MLFAPRKPKTTVWSDVSMQKSQNPCELLCFRSAFRVCDGMEGRGVGGVLQWITTSWITLNNQVTGLATLPLLRKAKLKVAPLELPFVSFRDIFWHSILAFFLTFCSDIHFWHSIWHVFWHSFRHLFWHSFWHSIWIYLVYLRRIFVVKFRRKTLWSRRRRADRWGTADSPPEKLRISPD